MSWIIREATTMDAAALGHVHVECWRETYAHLLSESFLGALDPVTRGERWAEVLAKPRPDERVVVLEVDGALRGFAWSGASHDEDEPRPLTLYALYLYATEYGSGAGQSLFDAVIGEAPASLWVAEDNPRAQAFYVRNGFAFDGTTKIEPRWENLREVRMVR
jgi:GNAT superfamily N-acetyltransferase